MVLRIDSPYVVIPVQDPYWRERCCLLATHLELALHHCWRQACSEYAGMFPGDLPEATGQPISLASGLLSDDTVSGCNLGVDICQGHVTRGMWAQRRAAGSFQPLCWGQLAADKFRWRVAWAFYAGFRCFVFNSRWWTCKLIGACQDRGLSQPMPLPWASLNYKSNQPQTTTLWVNVYCCLVSAWKDWMEKWASSPIDVQPPSGMAWNWLVVDMLLFGPVTWSLLEVVLQILLPVSPPDLRVQLICQSHMKVVTLQMNGLILGIQGNFSSGSQCGWQVSLMPTSMVKLVVWPPLWLQLNAMVWKCHAADTSLFDRAIWNWLWMRLTERTSQWRRGCFGFHQAQPNPSPTEYSCCQDCVDACLRYSSNGNCFSSSDIAK